jgi:hypothetical protein
VSFENFIQKSMKGLLGLGFKDFWAYYPTTLLIKHRSMGASSPLATRATLAAWAFCWMPAVTSAGRRPN